MVRSSKYNFFSDINITKNDIAFALSYKANHILEDDQLLLKVLFAHKWCAFYLQKLYRVHLLALLMPEIAVLHDIPQTKRGMNVFDHSVRVLNEVDKMICSPSYPDAVRIAMRIAAVYHDAGKASTYVSQNGKMSFYDHENESAILFNQFNDVYCVLDKRLQQFVDCVIRNHMSPLQYQRNPNWADGAVENFLRRCNNEYHFVIAFAKCDKLASSHNKSYLEPLDDLQRRCEEIMYGK